MCDSSRVEGRGVTRPCSSADHPVHPGHTHHARVACKKWEEHRVFSFASVYVPCTEGDAWQGLTRVRACGLWQQGAGATSQLASGSRSLSLRVRVRVTDKSDATGLGSPAPAPAHPGQQRSPTNPRPAAAEPGRSSTSPPTEVVVERCQVQRQAHSCQGRRAHRLTTKRNAPIQSGNLKTRL